LFFDVEYLDLSFGASQIGLQLFYLFIFADDGILIILDESISLLMD